MTLLVRVIGMLVIAAAAYRASAADRPSTVAVPEPVTWRAAPHVTAPVVTRTSQGGGGAKATNPLQGNPRAIADGAKLYVAYNCVDCHGVDGAGLMAPSLNDNRWRFGGSPADVFASISGGRPEGMPTWSRYLSADQIWRLTAYVGSLGTGKDVTTLAFTDLGVKRAGH